MSAQTRHDAGKDLHDPVDVGVTAVPAEGELEGAMGFLVEQAAGDERVGRFQGLGGAGRAGGGRYPLVLQQQQEQGLAFDPFEAEMRVVGEALHRMAVQVRVGDGGEHLVDQPVAQRGEPGRFGGQLLAGDPGGLGHPHDRRAGSRCPIAARAPGLRLW